ncbi:MAG TPA: hypothetical protein DCG19_01020 [Cryomorphaceae bacterium]|nr:hypothetical protein [Owenweeksia sp.]MBF99398.1 hypothetical protein [Owenweeksia sp.]HAD95949.1 hypothetical protein [Cryomorphaceae bacterium]HBF21860.1 hypothetical protein [Cryomorphaceae bacterium]|tara:strand:+ start:8771 stop:9328 length:558 start_codon:yes stop_codon:yes gene_type:complete
MKKILMIFAVSTVLFSCSKDDKDTNQQPNSSLTPQSVLPGEWKMTDTHQEGTTKMNGLVVNSFVTTGSNFKGTVLFEENPNKATANFGYDFKSVVTTHFGGQTSSQTFNDVIPQTPAVSTWSINSKGQLEGFNSDPSAATTTPFDVVIHSPTQITLKATANTSQSQQGTTIESEVKFEVSMEKLP